MFAGIAGKQQTSSPLPEFTARLERHHQGNIALEEPVNFKVFSVLKQHTLNC
jgi:hypothetical protein